MGVRFLKMAVVYILIGICLGIYMGSTNDFSLTTVHAHTNLFGWATFALCGFTYLRFPEAAQSPLAKWHFWLHGLGLPAMMILLIFILKGYTPGWLLGLKELAEVVAASGMAVFAVNVFRNVKVSDLVNK